MYVSQAKLGKIAMSTASRYWLLVGLDSFVNCQTQELKENRAFLEEQFPEVVDFEDLPHGQIQRQLMHWFREGDTRRQMAESCLRCFISNQIKEICRTLEDKFGKNHDFTIAELLPLVLDGIHRSSRQAIKGTQTNEQSLTTRILQTFDSDKSNLSTWTSRMLKSDRSVKRFLLEHGIELVTDWTILNYTSCGRLERVLTGFDRTPEEISFALQLLDSYHQVYRSQILSQRQAGSRKRYPDPTTEQMHQIAERLRTNIAYNTRRMSPERVLKELQDLANLLRAERTRASQGSSRSNFSNNEKQFTSSQNEDVEESSFLADYRQQFNTCLAQSVKQVIQARFTYIQGKKTEKTEKKAHNYLKALHLFHCQSVPLKQIASQLGFTDQPHLSRMLELKNLRSDIGRCTLSCLQKCVLELVQFRLNPDQLRVLESKLQVLLGEEIDTVIKKAEKEASTGHNRARNSQLAENICQYLNTRKEIL